MDRAPPQQKRMIIIASSALALGLGAMYYIKPANLKPETAAHENMTTNDGRVDANPTAQAKDIREKAK